MMLMSSVAVVSVKSVRSVGVVVLISTLLLALIPSMGIAQPTDSARRARRAERLGAMVFTTSSIEGTTNESIEIAGVERHYQLHVPPSYRASAAMPLVVAFHGLGGSGAQLERMTGLSLKSDEEGFIVAYPDGVNHMWRTATRKSATDDLAFVQALVREVSSRYTIDRRRVFATGMSNGGGMTNRVACDLADMFAAVASVSGAYNLSDSCNPARAIPVLAIHGRDDRIVPYGGRSDRVTLPAVEEWAAAWGEREGCVKQPQVSGDRARVEVRRWSGCREVSEVVLRTVSSMGHEWPGGMTSWRRRRDPTPPTRELVASDVVWDFLRQHTLP